MEDSRSRGGQRRRAGVVRQFRPERIERDLLAQAFELVFERHPQAGSREETAAVGGRAGTRCSSPVLAEVGGGRSGL